MRSRTPQQPLQKPCVQHLPCLPALKPRALSIFTVVLSKSSATLRRRKFEEVNHRKQRRNALCLPNQVTEGGRRESRESYLAIIVDGLQNC